MFRTKTKISLVLHDRCWLPPEFPLNLVTVIQLLHKFQLVSLTNAWELKAKFISDNNLTNPPKPDSIFYTNQMYHTYSGAQNAIEPSEVS